MSQEAFRAVFGDKDFIVKIAMMNNEGDVIVLKKNAFRKLEIDDNIFNPFHTGVILLTNDYNILENGETPYVFLGNGSDMLFIDIQPLNSSDRFLISLHCVVTETSEVVYDNSLCKKMVFVEYGQYALNSKFYNFMGSRGNTKVGGSNADSSIPTGDIIKNLLNKVFDGSDLSLFDVDPLTNQPVFDAQGCFPANIIPYNTLSYYSYLMYIMQLHSHQESPCVLKHDRKTKKFRLRALTKYFEDCSKLTVERLKFADPRQDGDSQELMPAVKFDVSDVYFGRESDIAEFYTETPASKNCIDHFANEMVTSYSRGCATYLYDTESLSKDAFVAKFKSLFVEPFRPTFNSYGLEPNLYTAPQQKDNWIDSQSYLPGDLNEQQFKNLKMLSLLFVNYIYIFKTTGNTLRSSGTFIDIIKNKNKEDKQTRWDYNTLGRHFVTCVKHIFTQNTYTNQIETIKPYRLVDPSKERVISDSLTNAGNSRLSDEAAATSTPNTNYQSDGLGTQVKELAIQNHSAAYTAARDAAERAGSPDPDLTASIAMLESGYLGSSMSNRANNPFGQTITEKQIGSNGIIGGTRGADGQLHAVYDSLESAMAHHVKKWGSKYVSGNPNTSTYNLVNAGYNTENRGWANYVTGIYSKNSKA